MCMEVSIMGVRTNIVLDDQIVNEVKKLTTLRTKKDVVDLALNELLKQLRRKRLIAIRHPGLWKGNLAQGRRSRIGTH
jgi:Arc/MetJ family transcription regulator